MYIRKAMSEDVEQIAYVHVKSWQTTYKGVLPQDMLDNLSYNVRRKQWTNNMENGNVYVAENRDGHIVGFSTGGREGTGQYPDYNGELYAIYILEAYQRQGIGRQLLKPVVDDLKAKGLNSMLVWVLEQNPAADFYRAFGATYLDSKEIQIAGNPYQEFAYGWSELPAIQ